MRNMFGLDDLEELERRAQIAEQLRAKAAGDKIFKEMLQMNLEDQFIAINAVCEAQGDIDLRTAQQKLIAVRSFPAYLSEMITRGQAAIEAQQEEPHED